MSAVNATLEFLGAGPLLRGSGGEEHRDKLRHLERSANLCPSAAQARLPICEGWPDKGSAFRHSRTSGKVVMVETPGLGTRVAKPRVMPGWPW